MASSPGHRHLLRQAGGGGTDRLLRPIPLSPEGSRGRSSTGSELGGTRGSGPESRRTAVSSRSSTSRPAFVHKLPHELHRIRPVVLTSGPDQIRARARRSRARSVRRSRSVRRTPDAKRGRTRRVSRPTKGSRGIARNAAIVAVCGMVRDIRLGFETRRAPQPSRLVAGARELALRAFGSEMREGPSSV